MPTRNIVPRANGEGGIGTSAKHWGNGYFDNLSLAGEDVAGTLSDMDLALAESTGYGIVSGCEPTISGLTVTVGAGIVHLANGTRKEISATNITLDAADASNPRIDLVYITSTGTVAKVTGTAAASPVVPTLPSGGISVCNVAIAAGASTGTVNRVQTIAPNLANYGVVNVKAFGAVGDGLHDDTAAIQAAIDSLENGGTLFFTDGTYFVNKSSAYNSIYPNNNQPCLIVYQKNNINITGSNAKIKTTVHAQGIVEIYNSTNVTIKGLTIEGCGLFPSIDTASGRGEKGVTGEGYYYSGYQFEEYLNNSVDTSNYTGFGSDSAHVWGTFHGGYIGNTGYGVLLQNSQYVTIECCKISGFNGAAIAIGTRANANAERSKNVFIKNNDLFRCYVAGVIIYYGDNIVVNNNIIHDIGHYEAFPNDGVYQYTYADPGYGISCSFAWKNPTEMVVSNYVDIIGNNINNCIRKGVDAHGGKHISVYCNTIKTCYGYGIQMEGYDFGEHTELEDINICNNRISDTGQRGNAIHLQNKNHSAVGKGIISGNMIFDCKCSTYALYTEYFHHVNVFGNNIHIVTDCQYGSVFESQESIFTGNIIRSEEQIISGIYVLVAERSIISKNTIITPNAQKQIAIRNATYSAFSDNIIIATNATNTEVDGQYCFLNGNMIKSLTNNENTMKTYVKAEITSDGNGNVRLTRLMGSNVISGYKDNNDGKGMTILFKPITARVDILYATNNFAYGDIGIANVKAISRSTSIVNGELKINMKNENNNYVPLDSVAANFIMTIIIYSERSY